jgi:hypothetical protein
MILGEFALPNQGCGFLHTYLSANNNNIRFKWFNGIPEKSQ